MNDSSGSGRDLAFSGLIAVKPPLEFRFPEAALSHWVQPTHCGQLQGIPSIDRYTPACRFRPPVPITIS